MAKVSTAGVKQPQGRKGIGCLGILLIIIIVPLVAIGGFLFFATADMRRSDEDILKSYQPSSDIADIAAQTILTDRGKAIFYRADPELVSGEVFRKYCFANGVEALACNAPKPGGGPFGGRKIFLLEIDDPQFVDHKYAASVHEMLHSAYQSLGSDEKKQVDALLDQEFSKHQDDFHLTGVVDILKSRKGNDIGDVRDELHSKFGVEYKDLAVELEDYYKKYFNDRQKVVELYANGGFNSRARRIDELKQETDLLNGKLTAMRAQLTAYQNAGDLTSYNNLVGQFNNMVYQYNAKAAEGHKVYSEIEKFYTYFNPDYKPPEQKQQ